MANTTVPVSLKPVAGFCIKSSTLQPAVYTPVSPAPSPSSLEPKNPPITIPAGFKIFVNIAWDANVPPPPECSEEAIKRAMEGQTSESDGANGSDEYFVPVVVSEGRQDTDKELSLQRIEAQTGLLLSRNIGTPNIAAKGKLEPRTVSIPSFLASKSSSEASHVAKKPLIEEITPAESEAVKKPKGILKTTQQPSPVAPRPSQIQQIPLQWSWSKQNDQIQIVISVPKLDNSVISKATFDIEPRRFILSIPNYPTLDVDLRISDAEIVS
ncbi:hypothetical protein VNI00_010047 [Paramarasmius palmivorus]|uniref:PIH1 N-terminal domain-containing protein n=1 Tax=Paramarasmius palmivorus TaxID=297713 RepID=A0AAW0CHA7_9AGAR